MWSFHDVISVNFFSIMMAMFSVYSLTFKNIMKNSGSFFYRNEYFHFETFLHFAAVFVELIKGTQRKILLYILYIY